MYNTWFICLNKLQAFLNKRKKISENCQSFGEQGKKKTPKVYGYILWYTLLFMKLNHLNKVKHQFYRYNKCNSFCIGVAFTLLHLISFG